MNPSPIKNLSFPHLKANYQQPFISNQSASNLYFFMQPNKPSCFQSGSKSKNDFVKDYSHKQIPHKVNHTHQQSVNISSKQDSHNNISTNSNKPLDDPLPTLKKRIQINNTSIKSQYNQIINNSFNSANSKTNHKANYSQNISHNKFIENDYSIPNINQSKSSIKSVGSILAYSANTHQGLIRNYNEDRVSIILNMKRPSYKSQDQKWPQCSYFAVYDGHGGAYTAEFLRDNLHQYIVKDDDFPSNPKNAIYNAFEKIEKQFLQNQQDKSGSCALSAMILDDLVYVANVGDSRAIAFQSGKIVQITTDHKPDNQIEEQRIRQNGGHIYQAQVPVSNGREIQYIQGPHRVTPGRLAVSRAFGDMEAKLPKYGGLQNVVSAEPDVFIFQADKYDFLLLGCDGIFDQLSNEQVCEAVWSTEEYSSIHQFCGKAVENVLKLSLEKKSFDNVTVVMLAFPSLEKALLKKKLKTKN